MTPELDYLAQTQGWVFSAGQAELAGFNSYQRRVLVNSGILRELRRGIYTFSATWDEHDARDRHRTTLAGALLIRGWSPDATRHRYVGGLRSAAFLLGLPFQPDPQDLAAIHAGGDTRQLTLEGRAVMAEVAQIRRGDGPRHIDLVSTDRCRRTYRNGVHVRPASLPADHVAFSQGVPITSMARTAVDLMREGTVTDALIAADGALHLGVTRSELGSVVRFCSSWTGGIQATEALGFADGLAESAAESLARWVCAQDEKIPPPELQVELWDAFGLIGRVDLFFRTFRVVLEVDGYIKYTDPWCKDMDEALRREHAREARLRTAGWTVVRTTWQELTTNPLGLICRLLAAFAAAK